MQNMSALYRFDAAVSREYYAQLKEAQGHFIGARKFRKRGQDRGEMACGNNKVRQSCTHTASQANTPGYAKTTLLPLQCPGQMFSINQLQRCGSCWCVFYCSEACQVLTVFLVYITINLDCCLPNSGKNCCREQTGAPDTGPCVNNMEQLQDLHWRLDCRKAVPIDLAYIPQMLLIVASAGRTCAMVGRCFGS